MHLIITERGFFVHKLRFIISVFIVLGLMLSSILSGCAEEEDSGILVVTSTSLLAQIVERVGEDIVDVVNIIPPAQCPGHFDVTPSDVQKLADADIFLLHGWQGEKFTDELISSADNPALTVEVILTEGNWMTPPVQLEAVNMVVEALSGVDAENSEFYEANADEYKDIIEAKGVEIESNLADYNLAGINVLCNEQQAGFVKWAGFNIIATYGRPDELTPQIVKDLVDTGKENSVTLIIDNLQSGADAGAGIAEELGCTRIILSNFPGGFDDTDTWEKAIDHNIELILTAITE